MLRMLRAPRTAAATGRDAVRSAVVSLPMIAPMTDDDASQRRTQAAAAKHAAAAEWLQVGMLLVVLATKRWWCI